MKNPFKTKETYYTSYDPNIDGTPDTSLLEAYTGISPRIAKVIGAVVGFSAVIGLAALLTGCGGSELRARYGEDKNDYQAHVNHQKPNAITLANAANNDYNLFSQSNEPTDYSDSIRYASLNQETPTNLYQSATNSLEGISTTP
jgi:hypothetical protein